MFQRKNQARAMMIFFILVGITYNAPAQDWRFTDVTVEAGMNFDPERQPTWNGVAVLDFDRDGWEDLLVTPSDAGANYLFRNKGDGTFEEVSAAAGLDQLNQVPFSPFCFDYDGDGWVDVLLASFVNSGNSKLFKNNGGVFQEMSDTGLENPWQVFSIAGGDYDLDGDIDLYMTINDSSKQSSQLFRNNGDGTFENVAEPAGILPSDEFEFDLEFTPTFADINNDMLPDLLVVADFNNSQHYINNGDGTFTNTTDPEVITDEGGMGSAVADYDNDGDLDWFVSSIWDPDQNPFRPWGVSTGNRLYRNLGDGTFEDATDDAGVRVGYWGWASFFADFNNDGHLDLFHTNGHIEDLGPFFAGDPSVLFISNQDGTFTDRHEELGLVDNGVGRGAVCFDYDKDGDLDIFIANAETSRTSKLWRNDGGNELGFVDISLVGTGMNPQGFGARLYLTPSNGTVVQMREINAGNNFLSQNPSNAHFGMGDAESGVLEIVWPDGTKNRLSPVRSQERLVIPKIPVSYDDPELSFWQYYARVKSSLEKSVSEGTITDDFARRMRYSASRAFIDTRNGN
jgi:hypothetical protein